jgi:hypothetical protein
MEDSLNRRVAAHELYMTQMLARLGFTPDDLERLSNGKAACSARERCETCRASHACSIWLDMRAEKPPIDIAQVPFFCPNREYLASLCAGRKG